MNPMRLGAFALVVCLMLGLFMLPRWAAGRDVPLDSFPLAACSTPGPATGRVFHVDPVHGSPAGDGSAANPWRDLNQLAAAGLIGEGKRDVRRADRLAARLLGGPPTVRVEPRPGVRVHTGDTVLLASGDYGDVDLSGLANSGFVTIAAAAGAEPRFTSLDLSRASHFILRGITVTAEAAPAGRRHLVSVYAPGTARADNIALEDLQIGLTRDIVTTPPGDFANASDGVILAGDCVTLKDSRLHDLKSAINVYRGRHVLIAGNAVDGVAIDGIQYSGRDIVIRDNVFANQWQTPSELHPDCMQGVGPGQEDSFGPVTITGNICIRALAGTDAIRAGRGKDVFGWMGINIFDGHWRGVTVRCNIVLPGAQHGIALYGVGDALIEGNVVLGMAEGRPSWITALPAQNGRQPDRVVIRDNRATTFLNAVKDAPAPVETMIDVIRVKREDPDILAVLRGKVTGVTLGSGNIWQTAEAPRAPLGRDARFVWQTGLPSLTPRDAAEARRLHPLPASCAGPA